MRTKDVRVILLEFPDPSETAQRTGCFISMQHSEIRNSQRKLPVAPISIAKEDAVTRAVHRLERPLALFNVELEHVILVVIPVTRSLPDAHIVHVWSLNFLIAALSIFGPQKLLDSVEDLCAVGEQKRTSGRGFVKKEKLLVLADFDMVPFLGLFQELQVLLHPLFVGESNATNTLQRIIGLISKEIG